MNKTETISEVSRAKPCDIKSIKEIEIDSNLGFWSVEDYFLEIERAGSLFFTAKIEGKTVGFILARPITNSDINLQCSEIEIYNIAVLKEYRRRSIASGLLNKVIELGLEENIQRIFLEVRKSNISAQKFYEKYAFKKIGERKNFYTNPPEDALLMCRVIKSI